MKVGILLLLVGIATACSSDPSKSTSASAKAAQADDPNGIICTYEKPTGSFLKEKRCTTLAEREAAKRQQGTMMDVRNERDSGIQ